MGSGSSSPNDKRHPLSVDRLVEARAREINSDRTSESTRAGLAAKRARGEKTGRPSVADRPELAQRIQKMRADGMTYRAIAARLTAEGVPTARGAREWRASSVQSAAGYQRPGRQQDRRHPDRLVSLARKMGYPPEMLREIERDREKLERQAEQLAARIKSEETSRSTKAALARKRARGECIGRPAVADRPDLKNRVPEMKQQKGMSHQAICDQLNAEGVPTIRGAAYWRPSAIQTILGYRRPDQRRGTTFARASRHETHRSVVPVSDHWRSRCRRQGDRRQRRAPSTRSGTRSGDPHDGGEPADPPGRRRAAEPSPRAAS